MSEELPGSSVRAPDQSVTRKWSGADALKAWLAEFRGAWTHVRVSGLAVKVSGTWWCRCMGLVLADSARHEMEGTPFIGSPDARAFQFVAGIERVSGLLVEIEGAIMPPEVVSRFEGEIRFVAGVDELMFREGIEHGAVRGAMYDAFATWPRLECGVESRSTFLDLIGAPSDGYSLMERIDRQFRSVGHGSMGSLAVAMGICGTAELLRPDMRSFIRVVAPLPLKVAGIEQSAERTSIIVTMDIGGTIEPGAVVCRLTGVTALGEVVPSASPEVVGLVEVCLPAPRVHGEATVLVLYRGRVVQEEKVTVLPRPRQSVRLAAVRAMEGNVPLLEPGFGRVEGRAAQSYWFERSCAHFLMLLGFGCFWWGPEIKSREDKAPRLPMPGNASDAIAMSADETVAILLECTTEQPGTEKVTKLVGRVRGLQKSIAAQVGSSSPTVHGVLALPIPRAEVSATIREAATLDSITLLTSDDFSAVLKLLASGASQREVEAVLPRALRHGLASLQRSSIWR